jgi:putative phage-type endonuclease
MSLINTYNELELEELRETKQLSDVWFKARGRCYFTGSTISTVLGLNPYKSRTKYILQKLGLEKQDHPSEYARKIMMWGRLNERNGIRIFENIHQQKERNRNVQCYDTGLHLYKNDHRFGASPDSIITNEDNEITGIVEVKCPRSIYECVKNKNPIIPTQHYLQVILEMMCVDVDCGYYVCWTENETCILFVNGWEDAWNCIQSHTEEYCNVFDDMKRKSNNKNINRITLIKTIRKCNRIGSKQKNELHRQLESIQRKTISYYGGSVTKETHFID